MSPEKQLFNITEATGEMLNGFLHILQTESGNTIVFRIYHIGGWCFDISKEYCCEPEDVDNYEGVEDDGYIYSFYEEWEGFNNDLTITGALELINKNTHLATNTNSIS